jgi:hypothetical protein
MSPLKFFARRNVYSVRKYVSLIYMHLEMKFASRGNARTFVLVSTLLKKNEQIPYSARSNTSNFGRPSSVARKLLRSQPHAKAH